MVVVYGLTVFLVLRREANRARGERNDDGILVHRDVKVAPFVVGSLVVSSIAAVPMFFYQTRRSAAGAAVGLGWGVLAMVPALLGFAGLVYHATHDSYDGTLSFDGRALTVDSCYTTDSGVTLTDDDAGVVNITSTTDGPTIASFTTFDASTNVMFLDCGKLAMADEGRGTMQGDCKVDEHAIAFDGEFECR